MFNWIYRLFSNRKPKNKAIGVFREPIIAENPKTGHKLTLHTHADAINNGFNLSSIGLCLNLMQNKHKGYVFRKASYVPIKRNYDYRRYN